MFLDSDTAASGPPANLGRWFILGGVLGLATAVVLTIGMANEYFSSGYVIALWPASMVQLIDPKTVGSKIAVGLIAYGSNFVLYGLFGIGIGFGSNRMRRLFRK